MSNSDVYQQVTDRIIAELEKGTAPWVKPWKDTRGAGSIPYNAVSGRHYSGVNILRKRWISGPNPGQVADTRRAPGRLPSPAARIGARRCGVAGYMDRGRASR